jgi:hypothetical protein
MLGVFVGLFLGWPAVTTCVILTLAGLFRRDHRLLVIAAIVAIPFSWFLSGFPDTRNAMLFAPLLLFTAGWTMSHKWEMAAWIFALPFLLIILLLAWAVLAGVA